MLKTSMSDYEKSSVVAYHFYFINRQSIHKTNCMQRLKKILMREVFPAIALNRINLDKLTFLINCEGILHTRYGKPNKTMTIDKYICTQGQGLHLKLFG